MEVISILKRAFLEGYATGNITVGAVLACLICTALLAVYIYVVYRIVNRNAFYNKSFNLSLAVIAVITSAIILTIQSNIVVSLGMVGALSIVRFRTAIKDPIDLAFLFWAISAGIICGAGFAVIAVVASLFVTLLIVLLSHSFGQAKPLVLVVNADSHKHEDEIMSAVKEFCSYAGTRARSVSRDGLHLAVEVKTSQPSELIDRLMSLDYVSNASLVENDSDMA